jgi:hypothetical protein
MVGIGRLAATWDVVDDVPDELKARDGDPLAPWTTKSVVANG